MSRKRRDAPVKSAGLNTELMQVGGLETELLLRDPTCRIVDTVPACCPHCGETRSKILALIREMHYLGQAPNGEARTHIVWYRVVCDHCDGVYAVAQHEMRTG